MTRLQTLVSRADLIINAALCGKKFQDLPAWIVDTRQDILDSLNASWEADHKEE